jgi:ABC-type branched-subunit amino acid transport system substrate-binding protein
MSKHLARESRSGAAGIAAFPTRCHATGKRLILVAIAAVVVGAYALPSASAAAATKGKDCSVKVGVVINTAVQSLVNSIDPSFRAEFNARVNSDTAKTQIANYSKMTDYVNQQGGIGGCTIEPVFALLALGAPDMAAEEQAACTSLTEDNEVQVAVLVETTFAQGLVDCLGKRSVPVVFGDQSVATKDWANGKKAGVYVPYDFYGERWAGMMNDLKSAGYFKRAPGGPPVKAGIIYRDSPVDTQLVDKALVPRLKKLGIPVETAAYSTNTAETASTFNSAVLKFKDAGVTNVIFGPGPVQMLFQNAAESQQYRPRYAFTSRNNMRFGVNLAPPAQFKDAVLVGWNPWLDGVPATEQPANSAVAACQKVYPPGQILGTESLTFGWCDEVTFLHEAGKNAPNLTAAGIAKGVAKLGTTWKSAQLYGGSAAFPGGRHDGANAVHILTYDEASKRFKLPTNSSAEVIP